MQARRFFLRTLASALTIGSLALASSAAAQTFPSRPLTLIVPYPTAGAADIFGRSIAQAMEATLKQTVVVENKPGAAGNVGLTQVARSKPDGYTIGLGTIGTQVHESIHVFPDAIRSWNGSCAHRTRVNDAKRDWSVAATSPWKNLGDVIKAAKAAGDKKLSYGTPGIGSSPHLTGAYFEAMAGVSSCSTFRSKASRLPCPR
jgi:tripartite-type tricarboxylate transporter receptor subunit TctC